MRNSLVILNFMTNLTTVEEGTVIAYGALLVGRQFVVITFKKGKDEIDS